MHTIFTKQEEEMIVAAIHEEELHTSAEIRVCVTDHKPWFPMRHAWKTFRKLGMEKTKDRNASLILIYSKKRTFVVLGDVALADAVEESYWITLAAEMRKKFQMNHKVSAVLYGIKTLGATSRALWNADPNDQNELPDEIVNV